LSAYARGQSDDARELVLDAVAEAGTLGELHQFAHDFRLQLRLLEDAELRATAERVTDEVLTAAVAAKDAELRAPELTADQELDDAIAAADAARASGRDTAAPHVARAIKAHRLQDRGELDAAAEVYESLLTTPIERIARIALSRVLLRRRNELVAARDVERLERVQERLLRLGAIGTIDRVLVAAPVLVQVGRPTEAQQQLRYALGAVSSTPKDRERLLQAIGEAALVARDLQAAREAFEAVVTSARRGNRHARVAQQYVRLAVVDMFSGRLADGRRDITQALAAWNEAGAFQTHWLLVQEIQELARTVLPGIRSALMPLLRLAGVEERALLESASDEADSDAPARDA
jgi:tetratricopeptide (TPR) repeat protein